MGITGLIPFLNKSSRRANIKEYAGQTVAIDAYCWLHKGAFSCADKLVMNEPTVMYVSYCMKLMNMLLSYNIKPILVFDGRYLPAKAETEKKRRESRLKNRQRGAELIRAGQVDEGRNFLRRSIDITHEMALNLIKKCRSRNIDCIVAPHEADAQLAYLNIKNIAQVVITEDSDLLLFNCVRVFFKMDINGNGLLIERDRIHISLGIRHDSFSIDKFRHMCILSGCDYLPSLPGIGLGKARKFILNTREENIYEALEKLPGRIRMRSLVVTEDYKNAFIKADRAFKYQLVYDPLKRKQVPLNETENENNFVGEKLDEDVAFQLAIGNLDPMTLKQVDFYDPDKVELVRNCKNILSHPSIWSKNFIPVVAKSTISTIPVYASTKGITVTTSLTPTASKRPVESYSSPEPQMTKDFLLNLYGRDLKLRQSEREKNEVTPERAEPYTSPVLFRKKNPFARPSPSNSSAKKRCLSGLARFKLNLNSDELLNSRYFSEKKSDFQTVAGNEASMEHLNGKQESFSGKICLDEYQNGQKINFSNNSIPSEELSNDLGKSTSEIQKNLSKFTDDFKVENDDDGNQLKCSQEENIFTPSNDENTVVDEFNRLMNGVIRENTVGVGSLNEISSIMNLHYSEKSRNYYDNAQISPYFVHKSPDKITVSTVSSPFRSPIRSAKNISVINNTKKASRNTASKYDKGKQQSLLTMFGFQPRPKIQSDKN